MNSFKVGIFFLVLNFCPKAQAADFETIKKDVYEVINSCPMYQIAADDLSEMVSKSIAEGKLDLDKFQLVMKNYCIMDLAIKAAKIDEKNGPAKVRKNKKVSIQCEDKTKKPKQIFNIIGEEKENGEVLAEGFSGKTYTKLTFNTLKPEQGRSIVVSVNGMELSKSLSPGLAPIEWETGWVSRKILGIDFDIKIKCYPESLTTIPTAESVVSDVVNVLPIIHDNINTHDNKLGVIDNSRKSKESIDFEPSSLPSQQNKSMQK